jgi:hypothetical protein
MAAKLSDISSLSIALTLLKNKREFKEFRSEVKDKKIDISTVAVEQVFKKYSSQSLVDLTINYICNLSLTAANPHEFCSDFVSKFCTNIPAHLKQQVADYFELKADINFDIYPTEDFP